MRYAVIMAGGAGKRLWPLSRLQRPKQLLPLLHGKSLLEMAVDRLAGVFDPKNIWIVTNADYVASIAAALPALPAENIVGEPEGRDTANAIALITEILGARDPNATIAVFTADHVIRPPECFALAVQKALDAAERHSDALLTFGVRPNWPHTGLGYIHAGQPIADGVYAVAGFKEKPDHQTARRYVEGGQYFWNSGMFVWTVQAIRAALLKHLPDTMAKLAPVAAALKKGQDFRPLLADIYAALTRISIDFAVMEKTDKVMMVELKCEWLDVGSWPALESVSAMDEAGNIVSARNAILLDSFRNIIVTEDDHLLAVLGIDECIVVHSSDVTLVCNKGDSQRIKELVAMVELKYGRKYL